MKLLPGDIQKNAGVAPRLQGVFLIACLCASFLAKAQLESEKGDNGKVGFKNNDSWVIQPIYDKVTEFNDHATAAVRLNGLWGFIDRSGKTILPFQYNDIEEEEGPYMTVVIHGKYGMVDLVKGTTLVACQYDKQFYFDNALYPRRGLIALVTRNGKDGVITLDGKEVVPCLYDSKSILEEDSLFYSVKINKKKGMIDSNGKSVVPCLFDEALINPDGFVDTQIGKKKGLYSLEGKEIAACKYDGYIIFEPDGFAVVALNKKYGLIDRAGNLVVPCRYEDENDLVSERNKLRKR